jgi:ABC-2 type transport system ATP-binding protein
VTAIQVENLRRDYRRGGKTVSALRGVTLAIPQGQIFGLLGPNGAGKTTFTKILATLLVPTSGSARVAGFDVEKATTAVRQRVGCVLGGDAGLYERLSGRDNMRYFAYLYGVPPKIARSRIPELLDLVGLSSKAAARVEIYSRGMRQRLHLARGLVHDPDVLLLDEPSIGIDPVGARELRALVAELRGRGKTILLTTHYMYEADELCDDIAVIVNGTIVARGTSAELKGQAKATSLVEIEVRGATAQALEELSRITAVHAMTVEERDQVQLVTVQTEPDEVPLGVLLAALQGSSIGRVNTREPTLEDAYIQLVQQHDRREVARVQQSA